jgi:hypothetical protein
MAGFEPSILCLWATHLTNIATTAYQKHTSFLAVVSLLMLVAEFEHMILGLWVKYFTNFATMAD